MKVLRLGTEESQGDKSISRSFRFQPWMPRRVEGGHTLFHSGDTAMMSDMKLIQEVYQPNNAILSVSGHFTMNPREAAYVVKNLLDVEVVLPSHTFPSEENAPSKEILHSLVQAFPVVEFMIDRDKEIVELLAGYGRTRVDVLGYGEEKEY